MGISGRWGHSVVTSNERHRYIRVTFLEALCAGNQPSACASALESLRATRTAQKAKEAPPDVAVSSLETDSEFCDSFAIFGVTIGNIWRN